MRQTHAADNGPSDSDSVDRRVWIELTGVLPEGQFLFAVFRAGQSQRILRVDAEDLTSSSAFQRRVARELALEILQVSQCELRPDDRLRAWRAAVRRALARG